jgi:hypothetical protein
MRVLRNTATGVALALTSAAALFAATPAAAQGPQSQPAPPPLTYIDFVGTCSDCAGSGVGVLTLQNFQLGSALSASNFLDFKYTSNLVSFDITSATLGSFSATFNELPGLARVDIAQAQPQGAGFFYNFHTFLSPQGESGQEWFVGSALATGPGSQLPAGDGGGVNQDFGLTYAWGLGSNADLPAAPGGGVPEPAAWTLLIAGFALAGGRLRSQRQVVA